MYTEQLYFAFPDGVYHYVCAECTAICCRGGGFGGSLKNEIRQLYVLYPNVESLAAERQGDYVGFFNPSDACIFLEGDNRCRIEREHGKAAKPSVCRLFPFNHFRHIGKAIAVLPHFTCPLRLQVPARPGHVEGTHSMLETAIRESDLLEQTYLDIHVTRPPLHKTADADLVLNREERFRDLCSLSLGERKFAGTVATESEDPKALENFVARAAGILGLPVPERRQGPRDVMDDVLLAIAPAFRFSLLSLTSEGILRALGLGELLARRAMSIASQPPSLKGTFGILQDITPTISLLARGDEPFDMLGEVRLKEPQFGNLDLNNAASVALGELSAGTLGPLEALEKAVTPSLSTPDRAILMRQLGVLIERASRVGRARQKKIGQ